MSDVAHPEIPVNPLQQKLEEIGHKEFARLVDDGKVPSLTDKFLKNYQFQAIADACERVPEDRLLEINVPKLDPAGKIVSKDGYIEHEKRMVFERAHVRKTLLAARGLTEKQMIAWESAQG